ncbi:MAG: hypothetical protein ACLFWH_06970 [Actinomycetota bacterium]
MELEVAVLERVRAYESLSRWERSELGRELRAMGLSYGEIMELIPVKKSTLATWCRDVKLTPEQVQAIEERRAPEPGIPRNTNRKRKAEIAELRSIARAEVSRLSADPVWMAGLILYWAEGSKGCNSVSLANTDPRALRLFVRWVRTYIDPNARFSMHMHLHEGNDEKLAREYWRRETGLLSANFHKTFIKPKGTDHRKNTHENGVCAVRLRRPADAWNIIMEWIDATTVHLALDHPRG